MAGFGVGGKNPEGVGRDETKTLKHIQKNRNVGALLEEIRHGMINWEKSCKGQPASAGHPDLDNSSERLRKSLRTQEETVLCPHFPVGTLYRHVSILPLTSPQAIKSLQRDLFH